MNTWVAAWVWSVVLTPRLATNSTPPETHIAQAEHASNAMSELIVCKDFIPAVVTLCRCQLHWVSDHATQVRHGNQPGFS